MSNFASVQIGADREFIDELDQQRQARGVTTMYDQIKTEATGSVTRLQYSGQGAETVTETVTRTSALDKPGIQAQSSVIATAVHPSSRRPLAPSDIRDDSLVRVNGIETTAKNARHMGLIEPAPHGGYQDAQGRQFAPAATTPRQAEQPPQAAPQDVGGGADQPSRASVDMTDEGATASLGDPDAEAFLGAVTETVPHEQVAAAMDEVVRDGQLSEQSIKRISSALGISDDEALAQVENLGRAYTGMITEAVGSVGIADSELLQDFMQWVGETRSRDGDQALKALYRTNSVQAFKDLGRKFMTDLDLYDPDLVLDMAQNSGISAHEDQHGRVVLNLPGVGPVRWSVAYGRGLIPSPVAD